MTTENQSITKTPTNKEKSNKYVVVRDGRRVSDREYDRKDDPEAVREMRFWERSASRFPDGTKVSISEYDAKLHRTWTIK